MPRAPAPTRPFWWGPDVGIAQRQLHGLQHRRRRQTLPVGSFKANPFGLFDTSGNVAEWVEDCWNDNYRGAPADGSAWITGQCRLRVLRGGAFDSQRSYVASDARSATTSTCGTPPTVFAWCASCLDREVAGSFRSTRFD